MILVDTAAWVCLIAAVAVRHGAGLLAADSDLDRLAAVMEIGLDNV